MGDESIMSAKSNGTNDAKPQSDLLFGIQDAELVERICSFNRHYAEHSGYFKSSTFDKDCNEEGVVYTFYDSITGKPLFKAPIGRSLAEFKAESKAHGWPSFRTEEVVWENVRVLPNGETVSLDGTHLGHDLPDRSGDRYCINLVCIAGKPVEE